MKSGKQLAFDTAAEIEVVVAQYFDPRRNVIVPNVWWGWGLRHECDLVVMTKTGYAYEVEIKVSRSDLKADLKKRWALQQKAAKAVFRRTGKTGGLRTGTGSGPCWHPYGISASRRQWVSVSGLRGKNKGSAN